MRNVVSFPFIAKVRSEIVKLVKPVRKLGIFGPQPICGAKIAFSATFDVIQPDFWDRVRYLIDTMS